MPARRQQERRDAIGPGLGTGAAGSHDDRAGRPTLVDDLDAKGHLRLDGDRGRDGTRCEGEEDAGSAHRVHHAANPNSEGVHQPPPDARHAIYEIRLTGGDELVREMAATFAKFASAQVERLAEASAAGALDQVADGSRDRADRWDRGRA
ncbi:MAG: hypothetical protein OEW77_02250 [Gemmatimonadota bacterium]|nr:hypothetical protein [Gemmatimonadota bacterium]